MVTASCMVTMCQTVGAKRRTENKFDIKEEKDWEEVDRPCICSQILSSEEGKELKIGLRKYAHVLSFTTQHLGLSSHVHFLGFILCFL